MLVWKSSVLSSGKKKSSELIVAFYNRSKCHKTFSNKKGSNNASQKIAILMQ